MILGARILPSTGNLVQRELEILLNRTLRIENITPDFVMFEIRDFTIDTCSLIVESKTIRNLYLVLKTFKFERPTDLYDNALSVNWYSFFTHEYSFAVIPDSKTLDRITIGRQVGQGVIDSFIKATGKRPKVNLENPQIKILAKTINNKCILGIDLIGHPLNDVDTICSRLTILPCFSLTTFGEIFHTGCCESFFELANRHQIRERIVNTTFADLLCIDQEKVINFLSAPLKQKFNAVYCFCVEEKKTTKYPIRYLPLEAFENEKISIFGSNLTKKFPSKNTQLESLENMLDLLKKNQLWQCGTILCRDEALEKIRVFNAKKLVKLNIRGISSTLIEITRE